MTDKPSEKLDLPDLFGRLCNDALDLEAQRKLQLELESNPEAQRLYVLYADMHVAMRQYANSCNSDEFLLREAQAALDASQTPTADVYGLPVKEAASSMEARLADWRDASLSGIQAAFSRLERHAHRLPAIAVSLFFAAIFTWWYWSAGPATMEQYEVDGTASRGEELGPAQLGGAVAARWAGKRLELIEGSQFWPEQRLELVEGLAEIRFLSGVRMILQGPAILEIEDENNATVSVGRVAATVPNDAGTFVLRTDLATISCEDGEYGIDVDVDESLLAQVYSGNIELKLSNSDPSSPKLEIASKQGVQIDAESGRLRQLDEEHRLHFVRYLPKHNVPINLADILAGGNGLGDGSREGYHQGISIDDATPISAYGAPAVGDGRYHKAKSFDLVDGVFIPNGERGPVQVDSIGRLFADFPATADECWGGVIMARRPALERSLPFMRLEIYGNNQGYVNWLHIASLPEELSPLGYGLIGMHSNCGITFDLHAIRARHPNKKVLRFRSLVGNLEGKQEAYVADAWVLVDGELRYSRRAFSREDGVEEIDIPLSDQDRFLVLAVTDSGKDTAYDWVAFGDPLIETTSDSEGVARRPAEHVVKDSWPAIATYSHLKQLFFSAVGQGTCLRFPFREKNRQYCHSESLSSNDEPSLAVSM